MIFDYSLRYDVNVMILNNSSLIIDTIFNRTKRKKNCKMPQRIVKSIIKLIQSINFFFHNLCYIEMLNLI